MDNIRDFEPNSERWLSLEDFEDEIWKYIPDYEGLYQVSNYGRVKSVERKVRKSNGLLMLVREKICKPYSCRGYMYVTLSKDGNQPNKKVHRLVAEAFIPNPNNYPDVNHKDEVLYNNFVFVNKDGSVDYENSNLEWCTKEYNRHYGTGLSRMKETWRRKYGVPIARYTIDGILLKVYDCGKDVEKDGFSRRAVYQCCKNSKMTHHNYKWRFA